MNHQNSENVTFRERLGKRSLSKDLIIVLTYIKNSCKKRK